MDDFLLVEGLDGSNTKCIHFMRKGDDGVNRYVATVYNMGLGDLPGVRDALIACIVSTTSCIFKTTPATDGVR